MPKIFATTNDEDVVSLLKSGGVGIMPTDTMYGIVAVANNKQAVQKIYQLKKRHNKPGTIIASSTQQLKNLGIAEADINRAKKYWPGPVSVVLACASDKTWLHQGQNSVAARVIRDKSLVDLLNKVGPLVTSSANITAHEPIKTIEEAIEIFGEAVDFYVDKGFVSPDNPSTVIGFDQTGQVKVLRSGVVKIT